MKRHDKPVTILLVEDNEGDIELTKESLSETRLINKLQVVTDGEEALDYLRKKGKFKDAPRPDIILLDINLPKKNGTEVLREIRFDKKLKSIPVIVLTTSDADNDILKMYDLYVNAYLTKPIDFNVFLEMMKIFSEFWIGIVKLP